MKGKSIRLAAVSALIFLLGGSWAWGATSEYELKAAFVYNFAKFMEWPSGALKPAADHIILGVLAQDPEKEAFEALQGKMVQGRTLVVKKCTVSELKDCQMIFISAAASRWLGQALSAVRDLPVLTVTDEVESAASRGIINLVTSGGKVRFQVNARQARQLGFKISSQLLQLALCVYD
jgi:YfiR/HmsC-like